MKIQPLSLPADKAKKERKQFAIAGLALSGIGLFAFWFLGIAGLALSARALVLTYHADNKKDDVNAKLRALAILGVIFGLIDVYFGMFVI